MSDKNFEYAGYCLLISLDHSSSLLWPLLWTTDHYGLHCLSSLALWLLAGFKLRYLPNAGHQIMRGKRIRDIDLSFSPPSLCFGCGFVVVVVGYVFVFFSFQPVSTTPTQLPTPMTGRGSGNTHPSLAFQTCCWSLQDLQ